jgi:RNA recognition motif-containing protein
MKDSDENCSGIKIFVGNVPFQCTDEDFKKCFKNIPGFIAAEIVTRHNSGHSRGFGFVTVKTEQDARELLRRNDIMFKDRVLRFTEYNQQNAIKLPKQQKNYLFVKNIPKNMDREELKSIFSEFAPVGACFVNTDIRTGESKGNAVVEIKDDFWFENLLNEKILPIKDWTFRVSRWRNVNRVRQPHNRDRKIDSQEIYRMAFNAGVNVGRLEGLRIAKNTSRNPYSEN